MKTSSKIKVCRLCFGQRWWERTVTVAASGSWEEKLLTKPFCVFWAGDFVADGARVIVDFVVVSSLKRHKKIHRHTIVVNHLTDVFFSQALYFLQIWLSKHVILLSSVFVSDLQISHNDTLVINCLFSLADTLKLYCVWSCTVCN